MKAVYRFIVRTLLYMFIILVGMLIMFYLMAPIYEFEEPTPFNGDMLYNPYADMDSSFWKQYNFQVQSKAWGGITEGRSNSNKLIDSIYQLLNFDHVATSDYQKINYYGKEKPSFIPTYEHGYNAFKVHQVCIGAKQVLWIDLILFQTISMKQWIIDMLSEDCEIVVIAHPLLRHGYSVEEVKYLNNYRIMEVLNNARISIDHWDAALSSGKLVWSMGNDDAHNVADSNQVGRKLTMINSPTTNREDIINSLKKGNSYSVNFFPLQDVFLSEKIERIKKIPKVQQVDLIGDTLFVMADSMATTIDFIGQNSVIKKTVVDSKSAFYVVQDDDTYIRTVFKYGSPDAIKWLDGTTIYLNPIVRHEGIEPASTTSSKVNKTATLWLRISYFLIALTIVYFFRRKRLRKT